MTKLTNLQSPELKTTVTKLCNASASELYNPAIAMNWPDTISEDLWCTSPELLSLFGCDEYERMDEPTRKRLGLLEAVNFCSLNIHGEKALIEGLAKRLYRKGNDEITPYLHHFIDEENKHMLYFGTFCGKYGGKIYQNRKVSFPRDYAPGEEDFLFFTKVMIFEAIVDAHNLRMALDERLHPVALEINAMHHKDEARHLVFGRQLVRELFQKFKGRWTVEVLSGIRNYLAAYFEATWREYYNPDVYRDLAINEPFKLQSSVWDSATARLHRTTMSSGCVEFLLNNEILLEAPRL